MAQRPDPGEHDARFQRDGTPAERARRDAELDGAVRGTQRAHRRGDGPGKRQNLTDFDAAFFREPGAARRGQAQGHINSRTWRRPASGDADGA